MQCLASSPNTHISVAETKRRSTDTQSLDHCLAGGTSTAHSCCTDLLPFPMCEELEVSGCCCWLVALPPSNILVYLRDGSVHTTAGAATLR